jgi:hypothetical protein
MNKKLTVLATTVLLGASALVSAPSATAATGTCGTYGAHYANNTVNTYICTSVRAWAQVKSTAPGNAGALLETRLGAWVGTNKQSVSISSSVPTSFPAYTTIVDGWEGRPN